MEDVLMNLIFYIGVRRSRLVCKQWERVANTNISLIYITNTNISIFDKMNVVKLRIIELSKIPYLPYLTELDDTRNIHSLDISHLTNLKKLTIGLCMEIPYLPKLEILVMKCPDTNKINELTTLTNLTIHGRYKPPITLTNLKTLNIKACCQEHIENLTNLQTLILRHPMDYYLDISHLVNLTNLKVDYDWGVNHVFPNLPKLTTLFIDNNDAIKDILHLTNLTSLTLKGNSVIEDISTLTNLTKLHLSGNIPFYDMSNLTDLDINDI